MRISKHCQKKVDKRYKCDEWGKKSRFFYKKKSVEQLGLEYKKGRGIKLIVANAMRNWENLKRMAILQTYYHYRGLAPKVYDIGWIDECPYLEVEYLSEEVRKKVPKLIKDKIIKIADESGFIKVYPIDIDISKNYIGNQFIDFHGFKLFWNKFEAILRREIDERTHWGHPNDKGEKFNYQGWDMYKIKGKREMNHRIQKMRLEDINFHNKTVLDIGCNLGMMSHYAASRGAKVIGVDLWRLIEISELWKYFNGLTDVEFHSKKLTPSNLGQFGEFDIVFFMAMVRSLKIPSKLAEITKELMVFEGHNMQDPKKVRRELEQIFPKVEFIGYTTDRGVRPVFWCK